MGKFAGFLKRIKNITNNIGNYIINELSKINDGYKYIKPKIKPLIDGALSFVPGGAIIGWGVEKGLDRASNLIDTAKYGIDHPNTFLPTTDISNDIRKGWGTENPNLTIEEVKATLKPGDILVYGPARWQPTCCNICWK